MAPKIFLITVNFMMPQKHLHPVETPMNTI
jgi:hypothetical protein